MPGTRVRKLATLFALLALVACSPRPTPATAPLWQIESPSGERGWLLGTIHSLTRPALWRSETVGAALDQAGTIVVEVDNLGDQAAMSRAFAELAGARGLPPLSQRVAPELREPLAALLKRGGLQESRFNGSDTWAAALMLARIGRETSEGAFGIDRAVIEAAGKRPVIELEGARKQLGLFDSLPEREQRDLLEAVVRDAADASAEGRKLTDAWRAGDMATIEAETRRGMLADPELRLALFTARNRAWTDRIVAMVTAREKPFVAVGAAHMAGPDGLAALIEAKGFKVTRLQ